MNDKIIGQIDTNLDLNKSKHLKNNFFASRVGIATRTWVEPN